MPPEKNKQETTGIPPVAAGTTLQFKVVLKGSRPPVWRRFQVPDGLTLSDLHDVLQIVMGWWDSHLHEFQLNGVRYGTRDLEYDDEPVIEETKVRLSDLPLSVKSTLRYEYDFGDSWEHVLTLEKILDAQETKTPVCLKGARSCPPEDCGGVWGYEEMLNTLNDPLDDEYESTKTWLPDDFDSERFDLDEVNRKLSRRKWKIPAPRKARKKA